MAPEVVAEAREENVLVLEVKKKGRNARAAAVVWAVQNWFLTHAAMLKPTADVVPQFKSRRAALAWAREEAAMGAELQQIAVGSIMLVVSFVIALVFYPLLTSSVATAQADGNSTSTQITLLGLIPTLFIIVLVLQGVQNLVSGARGLRARK